MERFVAFFRGLWGMGTTALWTLLCSIPIILSAPFSPRGRLPYSLGRFWAWLILKSNGVRLERQGAAHIRKDRSFVFISNHVSHLDSLAIALCIPNTLRFVAKASLAKIPVFSQAARMARVIFIDRGDSSRSRKTLTTALADLSEGISALFFAEGTRSTDGRLQALKKGGVILALQTGLPIVPVAVLGSQRSALSCAQFMRAQRMPFSTSCRIRPGSLAASLGRVTIIRV